MKTLLITVLLAALPCAASAATETRQLPSGDSVGVLPELVVTARRPVGTESVGLLPEIIITAERLPARKTKTRSTAVKALPPLKTASAPVLSASLAPQGVLTGL